MIRKTASPSLTEIASEWDELACYRAEQIDSGIDISFTHVLAPTMLRLLDGCNDSRILDVGCGSGHLTALVGQKAQSVVGIDVSRESIALGLSSFGTLQNVKFVVSSVEDFARSESGFTAAYANMSLITMPNLIEGVKAIHRVLEPGSCFAFTITHPWFWPYYWEYAGASWFNYNEEIVVNAPFRIWNQQLEKRATHIHRPLAMYAKVLRESGFTIDVLWEPSPTESAPKDYRRKWRFPRFLAVRALKS